MIVYGDPRFEQSLGALTERLARRSSALLSHREPTRDFDLLRQLLIDAGQLEQAVEDAPAGSFTPSQLAVFRPITDGAAEALCAAWQGQTPRLEGVRAAIDAAARSDVTLRVKLPEGFAFYALYPEQYCGAARNWSAAHSAAGQRRVVVIGVRSIGTSLSAVVAASLAADGWQVRRMTVRPTGHPFDRQVKIDAAKLGGADDALVVDEGPGASGTSMAATARALAQAGVEADRISFLPGHAGPPGPHAPQWASQWWARIRRYVVPLDEMRWGSRSLKQLLGAMTVRLLDASEVVPGVEDLSGGLWRNVVYRDRSVWPPAYALFERMKYRIMLKDGRAVLWKFAGLTSTPDGEVSAAEAEVRRIATRAERGWSMAPLGHAFGFVPVPWVEGTPLSHADKGEELLTRIGKYVAGSAGPALCPPDQEAGFMRVNQILEVNVRESLGEAAAERAKVWSQRVRPGGAQAYGEGRLAPHEWIRTNDGRILKVDCAGHEQDHTAVGRQPLAWDAAGALVEWAVEGPAALPLLQAAGMDDPPDVIAFYRAAYAAFRVGMCDTCRRATPDADEQSRLARAQEFYRAELARRLAEWVP